MFYYKKGFTLIELIIVISILWLLVLLSVPPVGSGGPSRSERRFNNEAKDCFLNQRFLSGAIEMYNMDNTEMIDSALPGKDFEGIIHLLIDKNYLKDHFELPTDECSYGFINMTNDGQVFCKKHGSIGSTYQNIKIPKYDKNLEIPFSSTYKKIREEKRQEFLDKKKEEEDIKHRKNFLNNPILPISILVFSILFAIYSAFTQKKGIKE